MGFANNTRKQHFVSQAEQRLNSINSDNKKIYSFSLVDGEKNIIKLDPSKGLKIENNLVACDLFSFSVENKTKLRKNFESCFSQYESNITTSTISLLNKISSKNFDVKSEILNLFIAKFINFLRNPYSIKKVLNTFGVAASFKPINQEFEKIYYEVASGKTPQQKCLCSNLGILEPEYKQWLTTIFMLLHRVEDGAPNQLESLIKELFENSKNQPYVIIFTYDGDKKCLLSDRGFTIPSSESGVLSFDFNLSHNAFIRYGFVDKNKLISKDVINFARRNPRNLNLLNKTLSSKNDINLHVYSNDFDSLSAYNKNTIYQCYKNVYCSTNNVDSVIF